MQLTEPMTAAGTLALRPDIVATELDDGAVLLDLETKYFFSLNASGWAIVRLFETGASLNQARSLATDLGLPADGNIDDFLSRLCDYGLLEHTMLESVPPPPLAAANTPWTPPAIERQAQPLQKVIVSAFDPSIPLAE